MGKSYLVNDILSSINIPFLSFDLEKEITLRRDIDNSVDFIDFQTLLTDKYGFNNHKIIFFNEAQESKKLARYFKSFKEDWPGVKVKLTGSSIKTYVFLWDEPNPFVFSALVSVNLFNTTKETT